MVLFSYIEEKYCINAQKNVAVEYTHHDDGKVMTQCLNKLTCTHKDCICDENE